MVKDAADLKRIIQTLSLGCWSCPKKILYNSFNTKQSWKKIRKLLMNEICEESRYSFSQRWQVVPSSSWSHRRSPPFKMKPMISSSWCNIVFWWRPSGSVHVRRPPKPLYPWLEDTETGQSREFGAVILQPSPWDPIKIQGPIRKQANVWSANLFW